VIEDGFASCQTMKGPAGVSLKSKTAQRGSKLLDCRYSDFSLELRISTLSS